MSMTDELDLCQEEEELLIQQLAGLNDKFSSLENTVESLLDQKNSEKTDHVVQQVHFTLVLLLVLLKMKNRDKSSNQNFLSFPGRKPLFLFSKIISVKV